MDQKITDQLPHGSGINGEWQIKVEGKVVILSNFFEAMNEVGMYCHNYPFSVEYLRGRKTLTYSDLTVSEEDICDCGFGLGEYLADTMPDVIEIDSAVSLEP